MKEDLKFENKVRLAGMYLDANTQVDGGRFNLIYITVQYENVRSKVEVLVNSNVYLTKLKNNQGVISIEGCFVSAKRVLALDVNFIRKEFKTQINK